MADDDLSWSMELVDEISTPAKEMSLSLLATGKSLKDVEANLATLGKAQRALDWAAETDPIKKSQIALELHRDALRETETEERKLARAQQDAAKAAADEANARGRAAAKEEADARRDQADSAKDSAAAIGIWTEVARETVAIATAVTGAVYDLGKEFFETGIEASNFRHAMEASLTVFEGSRIGATVAFQAIKELGNNAGIADEKTVQMYRSLRAAGFAAADATNVIRGALDVRALSGGDDTQAEAFEEIVDRIKATGDLSGRVFRQLADSGITKEGFEKALAADKGISVAQAAALVKDNRVKGDDATRALLDSISAVTGKKIGAQAEDFATGSLPGQIAKAKNLFNDLFEGIDSSPLTNIVKELNDELGGEFGQKMRADIEYSFGRIAYFAQKTADDPTVKKLGGILVEEIEKIPGAIDETIAVLDELGGAFKQIDPDGDSLRFIMKGLNVELGGVAFSGRVMAASIREADAAVEKLYDLFVSHKSAEEWGTGIREGLAKGLLGGDLEASITRFKDLITSIPKDIRDKLRIHSPSEETADIGFNMGEGIPMGWGRSSVGKKDFGKDVHAAITGSDFSPSVAAQSPVFAALAAQAPAAAPVYEISLSVGDIVIQGGESPHETAENVRAEIEQNFTQLAERIAGEFGAASQ